MRIEPLGELVRSRDVEEWLNSRPVPVPYLGGEELPFVIEDIEADEAPADFVKAITSFLSLTSFDREQATPYLFRNYRRFVEAVEEDDLDFSITSEPEVWKHVRFGDIHVARRYYGNREVYVQLAGGCDWDIEHGLQIVFRRGCILSRVSQQDGHLTTADAYGWPDEKDTIGDPR